MPELTILNPVEQFMGFALRLTAHKRKCSLIINQHPPRLKDLQGMVYKPDYPF
jgi:hypothetical protein